MKSTRIIGFSLGLAGLRHCDKQALLRRLLGEQCKVLLQCNALGSVSKGASEISQQRFRLQVGSQNSFGYLMSGDLWVSNEKEIHF
jgi:hypothetical protein